MYYPSIQSYVKFLNNLLYHGQFEAEAFWNIKFCMILLVVRARELLHCGPFTESDCFRALHLSIISVSKKNYFIFHRAKSDVSIFFFTFLNSACGGRLKPLITTTITNPTTDHQSLRLRPLLLVIQSFLVYRYRRIFSNHTWLMG